MSQQRYVVITLEDAHAIANGLRKHDLDRGSDAVARIVYRLRHETGADMQEIVDLLKGSEICAACSIEGQSSYCVAIEAQKQGRRLRRLLERAHGPAAPPVPTGSEGAP